MSFMVSSRKNEYWPLDAAINAAKRFFTNFLCNVRVYLRGFFEYGEAQADKYYYALINRFEQIVEQPYLYQAVDYIREGYRRSVCGVDSIYYRIDGDTIEIMHVLEQQDIDIFV